MDGKRTNCVVCLEPGWSTIVPLSENSSGRCRHGLIPEICAGLARVCIATLHATSRQRSPRHPRNRVRLTVKRIAGRRRARAPLRAGWIAAALLALPGGSPARAEQNLVPGSPGQLIFHERCAQCHGEQGQGISARVTIAGPPLQAEHNLPYVLETVRDGRGVMPSYGRVLRAEDIENVADYVTQHLAVIPLKGGNLTEGGVLYRTHCAACHRTAVRGGALAFVQTNAPALTDKSSAVVAGAIRWGPGPMPAFPSSQISDQQLASIVEYVQFVQHPPHPGGATLDWYGPVVEGLAAWAAVIVILGLTMWIERGGKG